MQMRLKVQLLVIGLFVSCFSMMGTGYESKSSATILAQGSSLIERIPAPPATNATGKQLDFLEFHKVPGNTIMLYKDPETSDYYYIAEPDKESLKEKWPATGNGIILRSLSGDDSSLWLRVKVKKGPEVTTVTSLEFWDGKDWRKAKAAERMASSSTRPLPPFTQVPEKHPGYCSLTNQMYVYAYSEWDCSSGTCCLIDVYTCPGFANTYRQRACCDGGQTTPFFVKSCQDYGVPL
jgi:hypothetical protein